MPKIMSLPLNPTQQALSDFFQKKFTPRLFQRLTNRARLELSHRTRQQNRNFSQKKFTTRWFQRLTNRIQTTKGDSTNHDSENYQPSFCCG